MLTRLHYIPVVSPFVIYTPHRAPKPCLYSSSLEFKGTVIALYPINSLRPCCKFPLILSWIMELNHSLPQDCDTCNRYTKSACFLISLQIYVFFLKYPNFFNRNLQNQLIKCPYLFLLSLTSCFLAWHKELESSHL